MSKNTQKTKILLLSEYFISKNKKDGLGLSNKKLQKLLYYAQAWSLVLNDKKIFNDKIEAWVHGPAIPLVYLEFKKFGFNDIKMKVNENDLESLSEKDKKVLDEVWRVYGKFDADYLELLTHNETPWQEARKGLQQYDNSGNEISVDLMKKYYGEKIKRKL
ncbi:MAG: DUF4065 domain-containing protein [Candidatus Taylorbacteria bacterium]|nr:DUF4065 domain-containing protein [Candidatus Taylorbacteria bacterium]